MDDAILRKVVDDIHRYHKEIIDAWCKAYLAQIYQETGRVPKPGDFVLNQQAMPHVNGQVGYKYWFTHKDE
jgi:hypothetical protein